MTSQSITAQSDDVRARLRSMWSKVAPAWGENAAYLDARGAPLTERMLERVALRDGERVLELACGPASVGRSAAGLVGARGEVVVSDFVPEMVEIAGSRVEELANVSARVLDLEAIDEPEGTFDVVLCRDGLMLVPDPARAAREIGRVLRPGGRTSVAVWGPRERNPWLGVVFDVVAEQLATPMPPRGVPHPFSLGDADRLASVLSGAGLTDVAIEEVEVPYAAASADEWWERSSSLAGPLAQRLAGLPEPVVEALRVRARQAARLYETPDGLVFPGVALVAFARR